MPTIRITRAEADRLVSELKWHKRDESFAISMDQDGDIWVVSGGGKHRRNLSLGHHAAACRVGSAKPEVFVAGAD